MLDGRFLRAFNNNIAFLKRFDIDRMLYWFRVNAGVPAPGAPYAAGDGHFENNLHGQTVGEFLMGAGTSLLWQEDLQLRSTVRALLNELRRISRMMVTWYRLIEKRFKQRNIPITRVPG